MMNLRNGHTGCRSTWLASVSFYVLCSACDPGRSNAASGSDRQQRDAEIADAGSNDAATTSKSAVAQPISSNDGWKPLAADEHYADKTLSDWAAEWVRWSYSQTSCDDPMLDPDGSRCAIYDDPESPVFFLATGEPGTDRTLCAAPAGKAIVIPLAAVSWDNAGVPEELQLTDEELEREVREIVATLSSTYLRVNGRDIPDLEPYRVEARGLDYTVPPPPNWFTCNGLSEVEGKVTPAFVGGAFIVLPPAQPGQHRIEFGGVLYVGGVKSVNEVAITLIVQ